MGARRTARERALQALYQLDVQATGSSAAEALEAAWGAGGDDPPASRDDQTSAFAMELVEGVRARQAELDVLIEGHSHHWRIDRMSRIDRNVLRLGAYELAHRPEIPRKVTINEAIELGRKFGSEDSSSFINGLLDRIADGVSK